MAFIGHCFAFLLFAVGYVTCLDCISCSWAVRNQTVDHNCLGAPYKSPGATCPMGSQGEVYVCQTRADFDVSGGIMSLELLERNCAVRHSKCNNACAVDSPMCFLCCDDNDKCNGFPVRANIVVSSAVHECISSVYLVAATSWAVWSMQWLL